MYFPYIVCVFVFPLTILCLNFLNIQVNKFLSYKDRCRPNKWFLTLKWVQNASMSFHRVLVKLAIFWLNLIFNGKDDKSPGFRDWHILNTLFSTLKWVWKCINKFPMSFCQVFIKLAMFWFNLSLIVRSKSIIVLEINVDLTHGF